ncbi:hypothetical protein DSO57_1026801 [Entomophthora muscae]|uniref:Uncharacterized protein n=1 Tax=Entomophthora muscae TaxID=34485 RepID=A0ACC2TCX1_9FUNG|nr:hypothetical protein DSO57_1026801 [Entomophthora muscae]
MDNTELAEPNLIQKLFLSLVRQDGKGDRVVCEEPYAVILLRLASWGVLLLFHALTVWLMLFAKTDMHKMVLVWCGLEWMFYAGCVLRTKFGRPVSPPVQISDARRRQVIEEILHEEGISHAIPGWFLPAEREMVTEKQAREWAAFSFYGVRVDELASKERDYIDSWLAKLQEKHEFKFCTRDVERQYMGPMIPEIQQRHLPLAWYFWYDSVKLIFGVFLLRLGFQRLYTKRHTYWYLDGDDERDPVFFVHGSGSDTSPYFIKFLRFKMMYPGRRAILLDLPYVALTPTLTVPSMEDILTTVDSIFNRHSLTKCSFGGHSYGSFVVSEIVKKRPHIVSRLLLIDPVCFVTWDPTLIRAFSFLPYGNVIQRCMHYFICLDPFMHNTNVSHPHWIENILLPSDIHFPTTVMLSEFDFLINVPLILQYLINCKKNNSDLDLTIVHNKDFTHSSYLLSTNSLDDALRAM